VYISIGNIAKDIHQQPLKWVIILLGYIPVTKLSCLSPRTPKGFTYWLFHYCTSLIVEPLIKAGQEGVMVTCTDNKICHVFPILAS
ncbi:hypothetical protein K439DRAFT_1509196, partial [Ramaria rubella]